jgi:hypothetical protein
MGLKTVQGAAAPAARPEPRLARGITKPLGAAVAITERVAEGDLTGKIEAGSKDETGRLLAALQRMQANLYEVASSIRDGARVVSGAAVEAARAGEQGRGFAVVISRASQEQRVVERFKLEAQAQAPVRPSAAEAVETAQVVPALRRVSVTFRALPGRIAPANRQCVTANSPGGEYSKLVGQGICACRSGS